VGGDAGPYAGKLETIATELRSHVPIRPVDLQAALQTMRDLPGLTVNATTRREEGRPNSYALVLDTDFKPIEGVVQLTNRGTDEIGPQFVLGQIVANNLLGREERIGLLFSGALQYDEYHGVGLFADVPINAHGTHVTASTFVSHSDPTETPNRDDIYDRSRTTLRMTRPVDAGASRKVALSIGIDFDDLELKRDGAPLRDEKLRVAEIGGRLIGNTGPSSQYLLAIQVRQGLAGIGSKLEAADLVYDTRRGDFLLTRVQFTHLTRFATNWTVRFDALGQTSAYVLPDVERYKIGGERLGRGFEVAAIAGDQGIGAKGELRRDLSTALDAFGKTSVYGFYDFGATWKQDVPDDRESATTAGFGISYEYRRLSGFIELAKPLTHADVEGNRDARVFAEINFKL
jgi:hemolysin activation/secretion protein